MVATYNINERDDLFRSECLIVVLLTQSSVPTDVNWFSALNIILDVNRYETHSTRAPCLQSVFDTSLGK